MVFDPTAGRLRDWFGRRNLLAAAELIGAALLFWRAQLLSVLLIASPPAVFPASGPHDIDHGNISGDRDAPNEIPVVSMSDTGMFSVGMLIGALMGGLLWRTDHCIAFQYSRLPFAAAVSSVIVLPRRTLPV